ncbi:carbon-nitrogen hydrolase domain-containing protein [Phthorimaea operculella]|nr:carbon-nitrogen hydrolase domain-containing protein [Phthorimaea operculella]
MMKQSLIFFACLLQFSTQRSTPQDASYVAAVVEYQTTGNMQRNLQNYRQHIADAAQQNADIVVFPEMTLTAGGHASEVPIHSLLKEFPVPAVRPDLYDQVLVNISSAARENQVYVVVNIQEAVDCTNSTPAGEECPEAKRYLFNTNVVFDRNGTVIDRYRKINLFGEFSRTPALSPDLGVFTTDFGVTFGHFICFDLMFQVPAVQTVEKLNLTDIIFTTMWFSEMPYLTAVQIQESYAYAMNVNFLASGANNVRVGSAGSGIYSGKRGALVSTMPGLPATRLLVSRVPKIPGQVDFPVPGPIYDSPADHDSLVLISDPSLPAHASRPLVPGFQEFTVVDKEVSCKFTVRMNQRAGEKSHQYTAFVHDGTNTYSKRQVGVARCAVVACKNSEAKSCSYKFDRTSKTVELEELSIEMRTHKLQYNNTLHCNNVVYYPSSFTINHFPLSHDNFTFTRDIPENKITHHREKINMKINKPQDELVAFGIWGRIYNRDVDHNVKEVSEEDIQKYLEFENGILIPKVDN